MNGKLKAILRTLEEARRQISEAMAGNPELQESLEQVELGIRQIKAKLEDLKGPEQTP
jgi:hypothetical protein